jgi:hypothetical protein
MVGGRKLFHACGIITSDNKIDRFAAPKRDTISANEVIYGPPLWARVVRTA